MVRATNVLPASGGGYWPFPSPVQTDTPLPGEPLGSITATVPGGGEYTYVGTATALYARTGGGSGWDDVSRPGGYALTSGARWEFAQFGTKIIAVCGGSEPMQVSDAGGPEFSDLVAVDSARKPRAAHIGLVYGFPVIGDTVDDLDGEQPSRVWWPRLIQVPNITDWTPNLSTFSGYSGSLPQAGDGDVLKIVGGEVGTIVCRRAIYRMRYVGSAPKIFEIDRVVRGKGAISSGAVIDNGMVTYFIDEDGPYAFDGQQAVPIGHGKVSHTIMRRLNMAAKDSIVASVIRGSGIILWALPLDGAEKPNRIIAYSPNDGRFSEVEIAASAIIETATPGVAWDEEPWSDRPLDEEPWASYVWDSPELMGGARTLTLFDATGAMSFLTGPGLPALLETNETGPFEPMVAEWTEVRPVVDDASLGTRVSVGVRMSVGDEVRWGTPAGLNRVGSAPVRSRGIYGRYRLEIPSGFRHAIGVSATPRPGGRA